MYRDVEYMIPQCNKYKTRPPGGSLQDTVCALYIATFLCMALVAQQTTREMLVVANCKNTPGKL